ncbi:putative phenylalanine--tRNA ligase alpha subunit [Astathelohania contejeani]|uniref:phenylalanine--tRNA ligase n=1 Tax=Astathelohania contejeani TaxID=164912 RepID=A0ABQ7I0M0_9MICR|nr:putative phenylalanine--tRNA ligase alpha subunit [Thelohania contejeani]
MDNLSHEILKKLKTKEPVTSYDFKITPEELHGCLLSLESRKMIKYKTEEKTVYELTEEGYKIINDGSPEVLFFNSLTNGNILSDEIKGIGKLYAFKNGWVSNKNGNMVPLVNEVKDEVRNQLEAVIKGDIKQDITILKKRKLIKSKKIIIYSVWKGDEYAETIKQQFSDITAEMILANDFNNLSFKSYNFNTIGNIPSYGNLHPLMKMKDEFKKIFVEMGFKEMKTNKYIESSFWNFDVLFTPQKHPARESHDTFFLNSKSDGFPPLLLENVRKMHSEGGYGSHGYMADWDIEEARKDILRTHTTAVSGKYLFELAKDFKPTKLFSIDKVFRNESVDATHLAEFHQVEGLIAGENLTLGHLMGVLQEFFTRLNMPNIKFKPAYNPYTEPSMEVFAYHEEMKRWMEVGNSGMFRPEMLKPMGFDDNVRVIAWGLSLERPAMIKYGLKSIRELFGHKVDLGFIKKTGFVQL